MLNTWLPPKGTKRNNTFTPYVRKNVDEKYVELYPYNIRVGHQDGKFNESSMVLFDFDTEVEIKVIYNNGNINKFDLRPHSYNIVANQVDDKTIIFSLKQDKDSPRKVVLSINGDIESECLHILTNPCETDPVKRDADNVFVISEGDEIPLVLPVGKDTYYFEKGVHNLPRGLWAELDLGDTYVINKFELHQASFFLNDCHVDGEKTDPQKFIIEGKGKEQEPYTLVFDGRNNKETNVLSIDIANKNLRYIRITLLGANIDKGWKFSNVINKFKVFSADTNEDVALSKAVDGAIKTYKNLTAKDSSQFITDTKSANWHSAESFFISRDGYKLYLEAGSIVKGSILSDGMNNITIRGRGILDSSELEHQDPGCGEARSGAIWLTGGKGYDIEGITVLDAPMWQIVLNYSRDIRVKNINLIGYVVNADGIHLSGCKRAEISGVFVRSCDDLIVMYHYGATEDIVVKNSVFLNDNAHVFLYGLGQTKDAYIKNCTIDNCDIVSHIEAPWQAPRFSGIFKLWANGRNYIENITIKNIRIDKFLYPANSCVFQFRTELRFKGELPGNYIKDIQFENIICEDDNESASLLSGMAYTEESNFITVGRDLKDTIEYEPYISNVRFKNYIRNGQVVKSLEDANIDVEGNVSSIVFL